MANKVVTVEDGKLLGIAGTNGQVLTWNGTTSEAEFASPGSGGTVTSVGLTGGTSGIVIGGTVSPITTSGTFNLDAPRRFAFDTASPIAPTSPGQISWNTLEGSLNTLMVGGNVDAIVGQQLYQRVVNVDTVTLTKGMVVYVFGSSGTRVNVKRAEADADLTSATILGVVAESIAQNAEGFIITNGLIRDLTVLPSTTFADGDVVYLSPTTPGGLTPTKPQAPQHLVMVGYCVKASNGAAGVLLVHPQNGYELGELHDVYINSPTSGQILIYDATTGQTRWENGSLTAGTGVTVTPGPGSLQVAIGQAVATTSSVTFSALALTGLSTGQYVKTPALGGSLTTVATIPASDVTGIPYDVAGEYAGTPVALTPILRFKAVRAFTIAASGHQGGSGTAPSSAVVCTVAVNGSGSNTITFTTGGSMTSNFSGTVAVAVGDLVTITTPANVYGIADLFFTLSATVG